MRVTVTDANIFIDLWELDWLHRLSALGLEIHTTNLVVQELNHKQRTALNFMLETGSLSIFELSDDQVFAMTEIGFPVGLSDSDKSLLWYLQQVPETGPLVLSGDRLLRNWCTRQGFEVHGILWIFDQLLMRRLISPPEAYEKLLDLMKANQWLPRKECWERLEEWGEKED